MIRTVLIALAGAATLGGCASHCQRDTPNFGQPDPYGGIARAQEGCVSSLRPVRRSDLREERTPA